VNPLYYVGLTTATLVSSLILFQGFNTTDATNTISLLAGFIVTCLGVHILTLSRQSMDAQTGHTALESGLLNPRLSLQGRASFEAWNDPADERGDGTPRSVTHGRRIYRAQSATLFNAGADTAVESVGLQELREEDEEDDDDGADERTQLHSAKRRGRRYESRNQNHSPNDPSLRDAHRDPPL